MAYECQENAWIKKCPNILKKKDIPGNPIKNLTFSPSRFLTSTNELPTSSNVVKELNLSFSSHADDSGIESDKLLSSFNLTSTPICEKSRKRKLTSAVTYDLGSPLKHSDPLFVSCFSAGNSSDHHEYEELPNSSEVTFETPMIRRYLNESVLRTPTPIKCGSNAGDSLQLSNFLPSLSEYDLNCEIPQTSSTLLPSMNLSDNATLTTKRKARKALLLEHDWSASKWSKENWPHKEDKTLATKLIDTHAPKTEPMGFISLEYPLPRSKMSVRRLSGLVGSRAVVKHKSLNFGGKSFYYTSRCQNSIGSSKVGKSRKQKPVLDEKWVSVACGCTEDQISITNAARRYMQRLSIEKSESINDLPTFSNR